MTILKQAEQAKLTPGEVRELVILIDAVLPGITKKVMEGEAYLINVSNLKKNLVELLPDTGVIDERTKKINELKEGEKLIKSAVEKLRYLEKQLSDIVS